jgi:hypothetical protein
VEASVKKELKEVKLNLPIDIYNEIEEIAKGLGSDVNDVIVKILDVISSYKNIIIELSKTLRVKKEHKVDSVFEELIYYGVEAWRGILEPLLRKLRASGRFELETLVFDPSGPSLEIELVALEGSDLLADALRIFWTLKGVTMEVIYYLEEGIEPPRGVKVDLHWDYLPDEHAIVVTIQAPSIDKLPPIYVIDKKVEPLL